jgi:hypothetical protein
LTNPAKTDGTLIHRAQQESEAQMPPARRIPMNQVSFDPEFTQGAVNAVQVCLRIQPDEKVCVITDEATLEIAAAIVREIEAVGA